MTLPELLLDEQRRREVVADSERVLDEEVASKSGVTGLAIKGGFKVVKKLDGGRMIPNAINDLLPDFCEAWEPHHAEYRGGDAESFEAYSHGREETLANALLAITDARAAHAENKVLKKVYAKLRPMGVKQIIAALPRVTRLVDKYAG